MKSLHYWQFLVITIIIYLKNSQSATIPDDETTESVSQIITNFYDNFYEIIDNGITEDLVDKQKVLIKKYDQILKNSKIINDPNSEIEAEKYLEEIIPKYHEMKRNMQEKLSIQDKKQAINEITKFINENRENLYNFNYRNFKNQTLKRHYKYLTELDISLVYKDDFIQHVIWQMLATFSDLSFRNIPLNEAIADVNKMETNWKGVRKLSKDNFLRTFVVPDYISAFINGYENHVDYQYSKYEIEHFLSKLESIINALSPFYMQLHAYLRHSLNKKYGDDIVSLSEPIPHHIVETLMLQAQSQELPFDYPYPEEEYSLNTKLFRRMAIKSLVDNANKFYTSIGFSNLPEDFLSKNLFELTEEIQNKRCQHHLMINSVEKTTLFVCPDINMKIYLEMLSELVGVYYYQFNRNTSSMFAAETFPAFTRSIGKAVQLSFQSPDSLKSFEFVSDISEEKNINRLYRLAIGTLFEITQIYTFQRIYNNLLNTKNPPGNCDYWELENEIRGVKPPVKRDNIMLDLNLNLIQEKPIFFETNSEPNILLEEILGYSIYKNLCKNSGQYISGDQEHPLNKCNLFGNQETGNLLKSILSADPIKPWYETFNDIFGEDGFNASGILEYFEPLKIWLEKENRKNDVAIGWTSTNNCNDE